MLESFSTKAVKLIEDAKNLSQEETELNGSELCVTTYHLLLAMFLSNDTICHFLLSEEEITFEDLIDAKNDITFNETKNTTFTKEFEEIVIKSSHIAQEVSSEYVYDEHIFYALLIHKYNMAANILKTLGLDIETLKQDIIEIFNFYNNDAIIIQNKQSDPKLKCLINLSTIPHAHPYIKRNTYIDQMIYILKKRQKNNPLLIGSAGVGKTALVEGLSEIYDQDIYQLDLGGMIAGTKYRGEMEEKIISSIEYVKNNQGVLFIDEIHNIVGAGSNEGSLDVANILKPYLSKGDIQVIAATTLEEYYQYMEKDKALIRRFQNIFIDEPNTFETINILKGIKPKYEEYYKVEIPNDLIEYIVKLTDELILNKKFPDKAIDVLDETLSRYKILKQDFKKIVNKVIEQTNGITLPTIDEFELINLSYEELKPFYLRKIYPLTITNNLGIIKVNEDFKIKLLISDLSKIFNFKKEMLLTLDLNDYITKESIQDLIGSSKGYIGYEQGGLLYNHILKYPIQVIYLKNFNQANPYLKTFFLMLFNKNYVVDSHSRYIYLKNTLFIVNDNHNSNHVGFITGNEQEKKYYDYNLKKKIILDNFEISSYLLKKGIVIENLKNYKEQDQINIFYKVINKPIGKYIVKRKNDEIILEAHLN